MCTNITNLDSFAHSIKKEEHHEVLLPIICKTYKKGRWRPTEPEVKALKSHFENNPYPTREEKKQIVHHLHQNFNSKVQINQLNRWFQNQRERTLDPYIQSLGKTIYKKFSQEHLALLKNSFSKNSYPKLHEMSALARELNVSRSKIENWFKHNRRSLVKQGSFTLKAKKYFNKEELTYLDKEFDNESHPSRKKIQEIAEHLSCHTLQIKNWFSNKRKKLRLFSNKEGPETREEKIEEDDQESPKTTLSSADLKSSQTQPLQSSYGSFSLLEDLKDSPCSGSNLEFSFNKIADQNSQGFYTLEKSLLVQASSTAAPVMFNINYGLEAVGMQQQPLSQFLTVSQQQNLTPTLSQTNILTSHLQPLFTKPVLTNHIPGSVLGKNMFLEFGFNPNPNPSNYEQSLTGLIPAWNKHHLQPVRYFQNNMKANLFDPISSLNLMNTTKRAILSLELEQTQQQHPSFYPFAHGLVPLSFR